MNTHNCGIFKSSLLKTAAFMQNSDQNVEKIQSYETGYRDLNFVKYLIWTMEQTFCKISDPYIKKTY